MYPPIGLKPESKDTSLTRPFICLSLSASTPGLQRGGRPRGWRVPDIAILEAFVQVEDHGIEDEFHGEADEEAADHGGCDATHGVGAAALGPEEGYEADEGGCDGHGFRADAHDGSVVDGVPEVVPGAEAAFAGEAVDGVVEVEEHDHAGLGVEAGEGDDADDGCEGEVVAEEVHEPEGADEAKRDGEHDHRHAEPALGRNVEEQDDQDEGERAGCDEAGEGAFPHFEGAGEGDGVTGGEGNIAGDGFAGFGDVGAEVAAGDVDEDPGGSLGVFAADHGGAGINGERGDLAEGNLCAGGGGDEEFSEGGNVVAVVAGEAEIEGVAFEAFDGGGDVHATDGGLDGVLDVAGGEAVAGGGIAVDVDVEVVSAEGAFGVAGDGAGDGADGS